MGFIGNRQFRIAIALLVIYATTKIEVDRISIFGVLAALLIIDLASIDINNSPKIPQIWTYLGDASYSIFLTHGPLISATTKILQKANL